MVYMYVECSTRQCLKAERRVLGNETSPSCSEVQDHSRSKPNASGGK